MNTAVKRTKSTALGKMYYPTRGPAKHRRGTFPTKRGSIIKAYKISANRPISILSALIYMCKSVAVKTG